MIFAHIITEVNPVTIEETIGTGTRDFENMVILKCFKEDDGWIYNLDEIFKILISFTPENN